MREFILFLKFAVLCTILLVVLILLPAPAFAQATAAFGTVSGTVPGAKVAPCAAATGTTCAPTTPGLRSATAGFPDGTNARRAEAGLRFVF